MITFKANAKCDDCNIEDVDVEVSLTTERHYISDSDGYQSLIRTTSVDIEYIVGWNMDLNKVRCPACMKLLQDNLRKMGR